MDYFSKNLEDTKAAAAALLGKIKNFPLRGARVVALKGDLGAGKTAFVQEVAKLLGVRERVASPTFIIEKIYKLQNCVFKHLIHIDAYRLESVQELRHLGWESLVTDTENIIFLEWPERVSGLLPKDTVFVCLAHVDKATRRITF